MAMLLSLLYIIQRSDNLNICRRAKIKKLFEKTSVKGLRSCISVCSNACCSSCSFIPINRHATYRGKSCFTSILQFLAYSARIPRVCSIGIRLIQLGEMTGYATVCLRQKNNIHNICQFI